MRPIKSIAVHGVLLLDKPSGISSNAALQAVRRLFYFPKAGHTGSLDPLATGMLPLCFGEATKFCRFLLEADKHYWVQARLGEKTSTGDSEGSIVACRPISCSIHEKWVTIIDKFLGSILQVPPMFSALKQGGKPLYRLARQNIFIERAPRLIRIHELILRDYNANQGILTLEVKCSKGTYIRTLIEDIGEALACGAHVISLRRLGVANFNSEGMVSLETVRHLDFLERFRLLLPIETGLRHWPQITLSEIQIVKIRQGQSIEIPKTKDVYLGLILLMDQTSGCFVGIGESLENGCVVPRRLVREYL